MTLDAILCFHYTRRSHRARQSCRSGLVRGCRYPPACASAFFRAFARCVACKIASTPCDYSAIPTRLASGTSSKSLPLIQRMTHIAALWAAQRCLRAGSSPRAHLRSRHGQMTKASPMARLPSGVSPNTIGPPEGTIARAQARTLRVQQTCQRHPSSLLSITVHSKCTLVTRARMARLALRS